MHGICKGIDAGYINISLVTAGYKVDSLLGSIESTKGSRLYVDEMFGKSKCY